MSTPILVTSELLTDASLFAGLAVLLAIVSLAAPVERRRGMLLSAVMAVLILAGLWALGRFGVRLGSGTLYDIAREALLALLAFAVIRAVLLFVTRVLLGRFNVPHILTDVLLTLGLIAYLLYRLTVIGVNLAGILTTSAVITGAIAFSAQEILGALWAGLALQGERTLRQGDWVRWDGKIGQVVAVRWRSMAIATCNNETIVVPNAAVMKDKITLLARVGNERALLRREVPFSVSYAHPPSQVIANVVEALRRAEIHNVAHEPELFVACSGFEDSGVGYEVHYYIHDLHHYVETDSAVLVHVFAALARRGMTIPFPHRVLQVQRDRGDRKALQEQASRLALLSRIDLFAPLTDAERQRLAAELVACPFVEHDVVFREGDAGDSLFLLCTGTLEVADDPAGGTRRRLASLRGPACFGEMGLLLGQHRTATVIAQSDALCYRLDKGGFDAILRARPEIVEALSTVLAQRQAENDATMAQLDADARAKHAGGVADVVRRIRDFFKLGPEE